MNDTVIVGILALIGTLAGTFGGILTAKNQGGDLQVTVIPEGNSISKLFLEGPVEILKIYDL